MDEMIELVGPLIPALRRYARSLLRNTAEADDLVQDCLERCLTRWHQRRADGDARTWVFTILHNLAINRLTQARRRGAHVELDDAGDAALARPAGQEDRVRHRELLRALAALPEEYRSVVLLVSVEGLAYAEAANVLGVPIGTVMSRLSRGRERLRQAMEGQSAGAQATATQAPHLRRVK